MTKLKVNYFTYLVNILTLFHFKAAFIKSGNGHEKKQNYPFDIMRSVCIYIQGVPQLSSHFVLLVFSASSSVHNSATFLMLLLKSSKKVVILNEISRK